MNKVEEIKARFHEAKAQLEEAKPAARRERAEATVEGRDPDPAVMDKASTLEAEIEQLPFDLYAAEIKTQQGLKSRGEKQMATYEPLKADAKQRLEDAKDARDAAESEYKAALNEFHKISDRISNGHRDKQSAESNLAKLYERGPVDVAKVQ